MRVSLRAVIGAALASVMATTGAAAAVPRTSIPGIAVVPASPWPATPLCGNAHGNQTAIPNGSLRLAQLNVLHGLTTEGDRTLEARLDLQVRELSAAHV